MGLFCGNWVLAWLLYYVGPSFLGLLYCAKPSFLGLLYCAGPSFLGPFYCAGPSFLGLLYCAGPSSLGLLYCAGPSSLGFLCKVLILTLLLCRYHMPFFLTQEKDDEEIIFNVSNVR
jgi:hypothetical protein